MKYENKILHTKNFDKPKLIIPKINRVNLNDPFFLEVFHNGGVIAGGYARYIFSTTDIEPGDIDIFCNEEKDFARLKSFLRKASHTVYETDLAISYDLEDFAYIKYKIQLIKPRQEGNIKTWGTPEEIIGNFDFTINMVAIYNNDIYYAENFQSDIHSKRLVFNNIHCPIGILARLRKYLRKGFTIPIPEMIKIYKVWDAEADKEGIMEVMREYTRTDFMDVEENKERDRKIFKIFYVD